MAKIEIDAQHLADLARIELEKSELKTIDPQLESIVEYVGKLSEVDTSDVPESAYITDAVNVLRADEVQGCEEDVRGRLIDAFPAKVGDALEVQGVFEERTE